MNGNKFGEQLAAFTIQWSSTTELFVIRVLFLNFNTSKMTLIIDYRHDRYQKIRVTVCVRAWRHN